MTNKKVFIYSIALVSAILYGCAKSEPTNVEEVTSTSVEVTLNTVILPLKNYDVRGKIGSEAVFSIILPNGVKPRGELTEESIHIPDGILCETLIMPEEDCIDIMLYNLQGDIGEYTIKIDGSAFEVDNGVVGDVIVPLVLDNNYLSDKISLKCSSSSTSIAPGGMLTGLLEYTGEVASYNLGNVSVTLTGFTADIEVISSTSSSQMLILSNIMPIEGSTETYFKICEGTAYDEDGAPCNGCRVDINIE